MLQVCRIFFISLPLFFYSTASTANKLDLFFSDNSADFAPFEENGKFGLKNTKGDILIPAEYDRLGWSNGAFSIVENVTGYHLNGQWGLINLSNQKITKADYTDISPGNGSILVARKKLPNSVSVKAGCITTTGKPVVPFIYDGISISSLRAIVYERIGNQFRHGLIDLENKTLIPMNFQMIYPLGSLRYGVVSFQEKTAIFSDEGKQLTGFVIDSISNFQKNYAIIYQEEHQGLMNREGNIVIEPLYREILIEADGTVKTRMTDNWILLAGDNVMKQQHNADSIEALMPGLLKVSAAGKTKLVNSNLKPLNNLLFSSIGNFQHGKAVFSSDGKKGVLRQNGSVAIPPVYNELLVEGKFIRAQKRMDSGKRWLLLDSTGQTISTKSYDYIEPAKGNFFPVSHRGFQGAIDQKGKEVIACVHDSLIQFLDNHIVVKFKGQYGIINDREEWIVTPKREKLTLIGHGLYLERVAANVFIRTFKGDVIYFTENRIELKNDFIFEYQSGGTIVKLDLQGRIVDRFVQDENIDKIFPESEGFRAIKRDGRYGFIDSRARLRIANRYEEVKSFSEGMAAARILGKWGFINKEDKIAVQPVYEEVFSFKQGYAIVRQKNQFGLIDKKGKLILPVRYDRIQVLPSNRFLIKQGNLTGLADADGQVVLNTKYNYISDLNNGYIIVERDGKFGVTTSEGLSTIPMIYDDIRFDPFHNQFMALKKAEWEVAKL